MASAWRETKRYALRSCSRIFLAGYRLIETIKPVKIAMSARATDCGGLKIGAIPCKSQARNAWAVVGHDFALLRNLCDLWVQKIPVTILKATSPMR